MRILNFYYDLEANPITFDFAYALSVASCECQLRRFDCLRLWLIEGNFRRRTIRDIRMSDAEKRWRVDNVLVPLARRCRFVKDIVLTARHPPPVNDSTTIFPPSYPKDNQVPFHARDLNKYFLNNISPLVFAPSEQALKKVSEILNREGFQDYVTITIRSSKYFSHRNSNIREISEMVTGFVKRGKYVVIIPDAEDPRKLDFGSSTYLAVEAALNLDLRFALCVRALMNFGPSNGPVATLFLTDGITIYQYDQLKSDHFGVGVEKGWLLTNGFPVGGNYPWALSNSQLRWIDFNAANVLNDYDVYVNT